MERDLRDDGQPCLGVIVALAVEAIPILATLILIATLLSK